MLKETTQERIEESIIRSFELDNEMVDFYDPNAVNISKKDIPTDISRKLKEYDEIPSMKLKYFDFILEDKFCGYVVICEQRKLLVSFALKIRDEKTKESFFSHIKKVLNDDFLCILYQKNIRGLKWLEKNGLTNEGVYEHDGHPMVVLKYKSKFLI
jgi:hypothetical protein